MSSPDSRPSPGSAVRQGLRPATFSGPWFNRPLPPSSRPRPSPRVPTTSPTASISCGTHLGGSMGKLDGKIVLITGGNSGIGLATAQLFVKEGAYVYVTERTPAKLDAAVKKMGLKISA